ncbi:MAG: PCMD domain-containing protein [Mangrovibacterium sp.]|nr:PCMD domain-containing protein [Mangrovibacterium sp.]
MSYRGAVVLLVFGSFFWGVKNAPAQIMYPSKASRGGKQIKYSGFDSWYDREVRESFVIGGKTQKLCEIGELSLSADNPLRKDSASCWSTTNLYAKIGVDIGINSVFPEPRAGGFCCRLESKLAEVSLVGLKLKVLVAGTVFLGEVIEPVRSLKDPVRQLNHGVPFAGKPGAVGFSYKYKQGQERVRSVYGANPVEGPDKGELCLILQKRWEDETGNVYARRIGGVRHFFDDTGNRWVNDTIIAVEYGDITSEPFYDPKTMGLIPEVSELYVRNSKNEMVPLTETGWGTCDETPTHLVLYFTSSFEGISYTGSPESVLWIDDVRFIY